MTKRGYYIDRDLVPGIVLYPGCGWFVEEYRTTTGAGAVSYSEVYDHHFCLVISVKARGRRAVVLTPSGLIEGDLQLESSWPV